MSRRLSRFALLIGLILLIGTSGCSKKSDPGPQLPTVRTDTATDITYHSAKVTVTILTEGGASSLGGVAYAKTPGPTLYDFIAPGSGAGTGSFTVNLPDLQANTRYYYRAYASNSVGTVYGAEKSFVTSNDAPPYIRFVPDSAIITQTELTLVGYVDSSGVSALSSVSFLLGTQPDLSDSTEINAPAQLGRATARFTGLLPGTRYYARMRARNERQTARSFIAFLTTAPR